MTRPGKACDTPGITNTPETTSDKLNKPAGQAGEHTTQYGIRKYRVRRARETVKERHRKRPLHRKSDRPTRSGSCLRQPPAEPGWTPPSARISCGTPARPPAC